MITELDGAAEQLPLSEQPEWADVQPASLDEAPTPVVAVKYEPHQREVLEYFHAIVASGEKSLRALALTEQVIGVNSANYTAWEYRWQCLEALGGSLDGERAYMQRIAQSNPKNYQLWNHRRRCAFKWGPERAQEELDFAHQCLMTDAKNYHAWAHCQALVERFGLWDQAMQCVHAIVEEDPRNNSAWNQRFLVTAHAPHMGSVAERFDRELAYTATQIARCPHNESAWNYLRGLCSLEGQQGQLALNPKMHDICCQTLANQPSCPPAWTLLADIYAAQARAAAAMQDAAAASKAAAHAQHCWGQLLVADPIRAAYWEHCCGNLRALVASGC